MTENMIMKTLEAQKLVGVRDAQLLLRAEALVSGAGREAVEVLLSDAALRVVKAEVQNDRVLFEGEVRCQAAYRLGSEKNARALTAKTALSHIFDMKGAQPGMLLSWDAVVEDVTAKYENGHMVFDAAVSLNAEVSALQNVEIMTETAKDGALQAKKEEIVSVKTAAENTAVCVLSDKTALPAALDARCTILEWATITDLNHTNEPGGVRVTGSVLVETLVSGGLASRPAALIKYTLPIDRYLEMPEWLLPGVRLTGRILGVSTEVEQAADGGDSTLNMEAEVEITALSEATDRISAVTDAYSASDEDVKVTKNTFEILTGRSVLQVKEPMRASVLLPEGAGAVGAVCAVKTRAAVGEVRAEGAKSVVSGVVNAQVMYMSQSGEKLMSAKSDFPFEIPIAAPLSEHTRVRVEAVNAEGNALMSDRVEVKCVLSMTMDRMKRDTVQTVKAIESAGENKIRRGCVIVWPSAGEDAWSVAKRYRVPVQQVENASGGGVSVGKAVVLRI